MTADVSAERLEALERVAALHRPVEEEGYAADCAGLTPDECDHDGECPLVKFSVCEHCAYLVNGGESWDDAIPADVIWPCPTAAALTSLSAPGEQA